MHSPNPCIDQTHALTKSMHRPNPMHSPNPCIDQTHALTKSMHQPNPMHSPYPCIDQTHALTKSMHRPNPMHAHSFNLFPSVFHNIPCPRRSTTTIPPIDPNSPAFTYSHDRINFGPQHALDLSCVHVRIGAGSPHNAFACTSAGYMLPSRLDALLIMCTAFSACLRACARRSLAGNENNYTKQL